MSRVGKKPIDIPANTKVNVEGGVVYVQGKNGKLQRPVPPNVEIVIGESVVTVEPAQDNRKCRAFQGLARSLVANMVHGVNEGFKRVLEINGIGYRAETSGNSITLNLGYSSPIVFDLPDGVSAAVDKKNTITLEAIDKELLGQTAASIRQLRPPEPYKGKGVKYAEEQIIRKAGKSGAK
ncbi:MAG: 50S ribosomal protein L6 [Desulfatibacillaceae bacterium]